MQGIQALAPVNLRELPWPKSYFMAIAQVRLELLENQGAYAADFEGFLATLCDSLPDGAL